MGYTGYCRIVTAVNKIQLCVYDLYNTSALPVLLYGSETWTLKARYARRITAAEMKHMRRT
jgi:hypothetical protein